MKLLIVGNGSIGVDENSYFYINNHTGYFLNKMSHTYEVCFLQNITVYNKDNNLQNFDLKKHNLNFKIAPRLKSFSSLPKLISLVSKYDSLYLFYPGTLSKSIALIAIILGKPFGLYIRGQYYKENSIDKFILKKAKYILTVSPSIARDLKKFCKNSDVIKPMISISLEDFKTDRIYEVKEQYRLLFVGRVEYRKGIFDLIEIANILKMKGLSFILDIVGGGDAFSEVKNFVEKNNLHTNICVHGLISDKEKLKSLYDSSDAFVFTSHDEGFPRVLYEAMASGLPIFTTFVGGISGRMINNENCFEIPLKNPIESADIVFNEMKSSNNLEYVANNSQCMLRDILNGTLIEHDELLVRSLNNEK